MILGTELEASSPIVIHSQVKRLEKRKETSKEPDIYPPSTRPKHVIKWFYLTHKTNFVGLFLENLFVINVFF